MPNHILFFHKGKKYYYQIIKLFINIISFFISTLKYSPLSLDNLYYLLFFGKLSAIMKAISLVICKWKCDITSGGI